MSISKHLKEHAILGISALPANTVTVGVGGMFPTIQAAVNFVETQINFIDSGVASTYEELVPESGFWTGLAVSDWANGSNIVTLAATATHANNEISGNTRLWLQAGSENQFYRIIAHREEESFLTDCKRIGTSIAGATDQITLWRENKWVIELLDARYEESVLISTNVCIRFVGTANTEWTGYQASALMKGSGFTYGVIEFKDVACLAEGNPGSIYSSAFMIGNVGSTGAWDEENTIELRFLEGCNLNTWQSDFISPAVQIGSVFMHHLTLASNPIISAAHLLYFIAQGTVQVSHITWNLIGVGVGIIEGDSYLFDATRARKLVIGHVHVNVQSGYDANGTLIIVQGGKFCEEIHVDNITISSDDAFAGLGSAARIGIVSMFTAVSGTGVAASKVYIGNCSLKFPNAPQGVINLYRGDSDTATEVYISDSSGGAVVPDAGDTIHCKVLDWVQALDYAAAITPNPNLGNTIDVGILTAAITVNAPANPIIGQKMRVLFEQGGVGNFGITWNAIFKAQVLAAGATGTKAAYDFEYDGVDWLQTNTVQWL